MPAERWAWRTITTSSFYTHNSYPLETSSGGSPPSFSQKDRNCVYKMRNLLQFSTPTPMYGENLCRIEKVTLRSPLTIAYTANTNSHRTHAVHKPYMVSLVPSSAISSRTSTRSALMSSTARASENPEPIAPHTRFHAWARGRPDGPCGPRNAPRRAPSQLPDGRLDRLAA